MKKILIGVTIFIIVLIVTGYSFLRTGLPDYTADIQATGLQAPVTIERNHYAVPTITALTLEDLFLRGDMSMRRTDCFRWSSHVVLHRGE